MNQKFFDRLKRKIEQIRKDIERPDFPVGEKAQIQIALTRFGRYMNRYHQLWGKLMPLWGKYGKHLSLHEAMKFATPEEFKIYEETWAELEKLNAGREKTAEEFASIEKRVKLSVLRAKDQHWTEVDERKMKAIRAWQLSQNHQAE